MKLAISYQRGPALTSSFFVAKEAEAEYRVCASDVLPLVVQDAIMNNEPGVATPDQIVTDLAAKCSTLGDFKIWAKKRKKKNRRAFEKMKEGKDGADGEKSENPFAKKEEKADASAAPVMTMPAAPAPGMVSSPMDMPPASLTPATDAAPSADPLASAPAEGESADEIQNSIRELQERLDAMRMSSNKAPAKTATKTEAPTDHRDNGESDGKPSPAKDPKAGQEVTHTENPKGHMDKGAAMEKIAINEDWSMNPKELEKEPKASKPLQAQPSGPISWNASEVKSEEVKHDKGGSGKSGSAVKKFFNRLPSGGAGEAPHALDLKSGVDDNVTLRKALEAEKAKTAAFLTKEATAALVDKIADIVTSLSEKNLIVAAKEEEIIKLLSGFKDLTILDGVHKLVASLSVRQAEVTPSADGAEIVSEDAPQVFESVSSSEDAVVMMSKIWNA